MNGTVEFDHIAPIYDETRRPPSEAEMRTLEEILAGCHSILDAGVGTGRFAAPLKAREFDVVGVDLSLGMMQRARSKGILRLVRADLRHLPFSSSSVDAAFTAHVLQLLPNPRDVLLELGRVARRTVVVLLPEWAENGPGEHWRSVRERYRELAAELGYALPPRGKRYRHTLDELSAIAPPTVVRTVEGSSGSPRSLGDWLSRWEAQATLGPPIPPEVHAEIVRRMQAESPAETPRAGRPRVQRFVAWSAGDLAAH